MGSEQSHQAQSFDGGHPTSPTSPRPGALSPRQESLCSEADQDIPYVSYTVNKPIGDSPKKTASKSQSSRYKFASPRRTKLSRSVHNTMVVVNQQDSTDSEDEELKRLKEIPSFLPIIRASLSGSTVKDPDILERLDYRGLLGLCQRYQHHLRYCAGVVSTEQAEICKKIRDVDQRVIEINNLLQDRHKKYNKHAEKLSKVSEMSKNLNKCHLLLNENIEQMEILNNMLPPEDRLEPFVWTTG